MLYLYLYLILSYIYGYFLQFAPSMLFHVELLISRETLNCLCLGSDLTFFYFMESGKLTLTWDAYVNAVMGEKQNKVNFGDWRQVELFQGFIF